MQFEELDEFGRFLSALGDLLNEPLGIHREFSGCLVGDECDRYLDKGDTI